MRCSDQCQTCPDCGFDLETYFEISKSKQKKHIDKQTFMFLGIAVVVITAIVATVRIKKDFAHESIIQNAAMGSSESSEEAAETVNDDSFPELGLISQDFNESPADESAGHQQKEADADKEANNDSVDDSEEKPGEVDVSGVYTGDDHEALVLDTDGMAYYYCIQKQYTDLQCPWYVEDDRVYIALARLHCTIYADINADELIFKSDRINWNPEVFTKVNVSPEEYLTRKLTTYDPKGTLNIDGTITYQNEGFQNLQSYAVTGYYAIFYNSKASNMNIIAIMQNGSRSIDNSEAFKSMLDNAW